MNRTAELAGRRERLVRRSRQLRTALGDEAHSVATRLRYADRLSALARSGTVRAGAAAIAALALFGRPRALFRTAGRLAVLWPVLRPLWPVLRGLWRRSAH